MAAFFFVRNTHGRGMPTFMDLKGQRFGKILVLRFAKINKFGQAIFRVKCDCGTKWLISATSLRQQGTRRCRPCSREQRGYTKKYVGEYSSYGSMKSRCLDKNVTGYDSYGGRGIKICPQWLGPGGFIQFVTDVGRRPKGKTLDRINPEGHYEPGNVRWATDEQQSNNRRLNYTEAELKKMRKQGDVVAKSFEEAEAELSGACF